MASIVSICNLALSNLAKDNISDLAESSPEARACNQFYQHVLEVMLQGYPWRFAGKTVSLAEVTNTKPGSWTHAYRLPTDHLKTRLIRPDYSEDDPRPDAPDDKPMGHPYDIEGTTIFCNLSPAFLRYTWRLSDPTKFSPLFVEAFGWQLAVRLAMPLTRDPKIRADAYQLAGQATSVAATADANEVRETSDHQSDFVAAR